MSTRPGSTLAATDAALDEPEPDGGAVVPEPPPGGANNPEPPFDGVPPLAAAFGVTLAGRRTA
jgi:hypothetical protein